MVRVEGVGKLVGRMRHMSLDAASVPGGLLPLGSEESALQEDQALHIRLGLGSPSWWNQSWFYNPF